MKLLVSTAFQGKNQIGKKNEEIRNTANSIQPPFT